MTPVGTHVWFPLWTAFSDCHRSLSGSFLDLFSKTLWQRCDAHAALCLEMPGMAVKYKAPRDPDCPPREQSPTSSTHSLFFANSSATDVSVTSLFFKNHITVLTP